LIETATARNGAVVLAAMVWACVAATPHRAGAAAFQLREDSAVNLGSAFAGSASAANGPATVFDNPAGMTRLPGLQVQLGGALVAPSFVFQGTSASALGRPNAGFDNRDGGNLDLIPHGFITYRFDRLALGLGVTAPYGLDTYYGPGFVGRYQADKTSLRTININPSVAYQVTPWLSLGVGVSAQYADAEFSTFLNSSALAFQALGRPLALPDGHFALHGDDWAFGYNVGALIQPAPGTNIGLAYRSRVQHDFSGTADFIVPAPLNLSPRFRNSGGAAKLVLPDTATISLTQRLDSRWTLLGELSWTNWSQFKNLNVYRTDGTLLSSTPERYRDGIFAALGASYVLDDRLTLRGGIAYDKTPVSEAYRTARVPDQDRYWLAAGLSYRAIANATIDFGYAHLFVPGATIRETSSTGDVLSGSYSSSVDIVSLGTRMTF
jgi:long-chain fatty acid transport protein